MKLKTKILGEEITEQVKVRTTKTLLKLFDEESDRTVGNRTNLFNKILYERYFLKKKKPL